MTCPLVDISKIYLHQLHLSQVKTNVALKLQRERTKHNIHSKNFAEEEAEEENQTQVTLITIELEEILHSIKDKVL